jgi:hypothetical protein
MREPHDKLGHGVVLKCQASAWVRTNHDFPSLAQLSEAYTLNPGLSSRRKGAGRSILWDTSQSTIGCHENIQNSLQQLHASQAQPSETRAQMP